MIRILEEIYELLAENVSQLFLLKLDAIYTALLWRKRICAF